MAANADKRGDDVKIERKTNSKERANWLSKFFFLWLMPLFKKGTVKDLTTQDLCQPLRSDQSEDLANKLEKNWCLELIKADKASRKPSLLRALVRTFISSYLLDGFLIFILCIVCKAFQPICLAFLIDYFAVGSTVPRKEAYMYAGAVVGLSLLGVFIQHHTTLRQFQLGMRLRVACCSLLYRKVLRLSSKSLGQTTAGQLVNLMSNDVNRFDNVLLHLHYLWIMPFQILLVCYLIYTRVDIAALIGVAVITMQTIPVQSYLSKLSSNLRKKIAQRTDERVRIMSEIISGIQVIKMYAWEKPFEKVVSIARDHELKAITKTSYLRGIYMAFMVFTERFTLYITLLAYTLLGHPVTSATVFSLAQFYNTLQATMSIIYPTAVSSAAECLVTIKRLETFLLLDERPDLKLVESEMSKLKDVGKYVKSEEDEVVKYEKHEIEGNGFCNLGYDNSEFSMELDRTEEIAVDIKNVTASWTADKSVLTLNGINIQIPKGKLFAIIGSVGSGKSSILQLLLKELPIMSGSVDVQGSVSFSSQEAWLFVATVRNNILFGLPYDQKRYREVVRVCALEKDFQQFPRGDQTLVGERGVSLSGGQRARINLARAVYREADVYLLDDPLSAVDAHVGRHLFAECIGRYLKGHTTILVTHQLHYLKAADVIVIMKNGHVENIGTYEELASSGHDFASLLAAMQEGNKESHDHDDNHPKSGTKLGRKASEVSTVSSIRSEPAEDVEAEELEAEEQLTGGMKKGTYWEYWKNGGSFCFVFTMVFVMILGQLSATASDYWVTFWTNQQNLQTYEKEFDSSVDGLNKTDYEDAFSVRQALNDSDFNMYDKIGPFNTVEYLYIYTGIIAACVILTIGRTLLFFKVCMNASKRLHDQMFHKILRGVMRFFDTNPSGRILNRFSKDIGAVDELLPKATIEAVQIFLVMASILFLVSVTNVWMLIPVALILTIFYFVFILYLNTAQDIKRLEGITRSPVFSHLSASLNGITTIRASGASKRLAYEFDIHQDLHTSAWYQYIACSSHLGFWLDMLCTVFLAVVAFTFIFFDDGKSLAGDVGLAISQSLILCGMLQFGVRQAAEIVSQMTSVERVLQYNTIEHEEGLEKGVNPTPDKWPSAGSIRFEHTYMRYSSDADPVLKDLNVTVQSGWKVGIVGRTGAGKSSLISALFRLAKIDGGIKIDEVETKYLAKQDLRSRISIIPQEPVLFSATVRYNLDPFGKYDDAALWRALEAVELKDAITSLEFKVSEGGANFSLGQRQLVCLARAILRNNQILVLDEATANVDPQTDSFIQKTIRDQFGSCTVLTIAHRLNTIMDSDRVLVMDTGTMVEYDHPYILLCNQDGPFAKMVQETGIEMAAGLRVVAREAYVKKGGVLGDNEIKEMSEDNSENSDEGEEF